MRFLVALNDVGGVDDDDDGGVVTDTESEDNDGVDDV